MAKTREEFVELLKDEAFVDALVAAKTSEEGAALLKEKGFDMTPADYEKLMDGVDAIADADVEAVAGGTSNIKNTNVNVAGIQTNKSINMTTVKITDNSTYMDIWAEIENIN